MFFYSDEDKKILKLYHCTTPAKIQKYYNTGKIIKPVRGFVNPLAAFLWASSHGRNIILEVSGEAFNAHRLPDHHNVAGEAWYFNQDITEWECVLSSSPSKILKFLNSLVPFLKELNDATATRIVSNQMQKYSKNTGVCDSVRD